MFSSHSALYRRAAPALQEHLLAGGEIAIDTDDANTASYSTCGLAPDADVEIELSDPAMLEYTVKLHVVNLAASPVPMLCQY